MLWGLKDLNIEQGLIEFSNDGNLLVVENNFMLANNRKQSVRGDTT